MAEFENLKNSLASHLLIKSSRLLFRCLVQDLNQAHGLNLSENHVRLFAYIGLEGSCVSNIAKEIGVSKQAVSKLVKSLVDKKILKYDFSVDDGRSKLIRFSSGAKSSIKKNLEMMHSRDKEISKIIGGAADLDKLKLYLLKIQEYYEGEL